MIQQPSTRGLVPGQIRRCGIALGSNVGDRLDHLRAAARALDWLADFSQPILRAPIYETDPVGCAPGTTAFFNSVIEIGFFGEPDALMSRLRAIETALGRPAARATNEPRTIDLDLLYADTLAFATVELTLPHPRLAERRFVLGPLAEIRPELLLPGQTKTVRELFDALPETGAPLRLITRDWS